MPHSIPDDNMSSPRGVVKDEPMEDTAIPSEITDANKDNSHVDVDTDVDIDIDIDMEGGSTQEEAPAAVKKEVKLDELFADVESDDEFPSSAPVAKDPVSSSPSAAPASPM